MIRAFARFTVTPELARELKIPNMEKPGQFLWPPPTDLSQLLAAIREDPFIISEAARVLTTTRVTSAPSKTTGGRPPRPSGASANLKSNRPPRLEAAKERDRQAHRERGWPSG